MQPPVPLCFPHGGPNTRPPASRALPLVSSAGKNGPGCPGDKGGIDDQGEGAGWVSTTAACYAWTRRTRCYCATMTRTCMRWSATSWTPRRATRAGCWRHPTTSTYSASTDMSSGRRARRRSAPKGTLSTPCRRRLTTGTFPSKPVAASVCDCSLADSSFSFVDRCGVVIVQLCA
jgi:hypothetical protein